MNYLGHLYFSNNDTELMYANIFGDFVKGKDLSRYPKKIQKGIRLHRTIDDYIDHHPAVIELMHELYAPLPKIAGIAIDLYFDHLLAINWSDYHNLPLDDFIEKFQTASIDREPYDKEFFWTVLSKMKEEEWLHHYQTTYGLTKACQGLSARISFPNVLHTAPQVFEENTQKIETCFHIFMTDAVPFYRDYYAENGL